MEGLRRIIEQHSATELAEIIFNDLSVYHYQKLFIAMKKANSKINNHDYEDVKSSGAIVTGVYIDGGDQKTLLNLQKAFGIAPKTFEEELIEKEIKEWQRSGHQVKFTVNEDERIVVAEIKKGEKVVGSGLALCHPLDTFDENVGKLIAIIKADFPKRWRERLITLGYDRKL